MVEGHSVLQTPFLVKTIFMPPTSKKLRRHIGFGPSVCPLHFHSVKNR